MSKVILSFSNSDLRKRCVGMSRALNSVLREELSFLAKHPKFQAWLRWGGKPKSLGLLICSDAEIRKFHRDYRKMDKATDVLSFPTIEASAISSTELQGYLGDLIISLESVERAAKRVKRPLTEEFLEVFIHGVLHLLGFDHLLGKSITRKDAIEMKSLQAQLFASLRAPIKKRYGNFVKKR